jgi:predicted MPP superfamily phosphohydrolase
MSSAGPRSVLRWTLRSSLLGCLLCAVWAFFIEPSRLVIHRQDLVLPRWPRPLAGLRVALLSDLHVGSPHWGIERVRELVVQTNAEHPDLILLAGDFMITGIPFGTETPPELIAQALAELRAPLGVVAVLGNHDAWLAGDPVTRAFRARGLTLLENELYSVTRAGVPLTIVGLADLLTRPQRVQQTIDDVPAANTVLVLAHEPDVFPQIGARPALTLAGHTHGGQVNVPFLGRVWVPSQFGERYAAGHVSENGRHLFVTTGVGTSIIPVRFRVPPELVMLTLR